MALTAHKLAVCDYDDVDFHGIREESVDLGLNPSWGGGSGDAYATMISLLGARPSLAISTTDLKTFIDKVGLYYATVTAGAVFTSYWTKTSDGGANDAGSVHEKRVINKGLLAVSQIEADDEDIARLGFGVFATYDGTNDPIALSANSALGAAGNVTTRFTLGPVELMGTQLEGVQGVTITPGVTVDARRADGFKWPRHSSCRVSGTMIEIRTLDAAAQRTFGIDGTVLSADGAEVWLRKLGTGAAPVANATSEHIKLTGLKGMVVAGPASASHPDDVVSVVSVFLAYNTTGPVLPLTVNTATTIPAGL